MQLLSSNVRVSDVSSDVVGFLVWWYRMIFLTGSALKVLSVGDGKIPTKKGRFELKTL